MKLSRMENKIGCMLFDAVYRREETLEDIVEHAITWYSEEENVTNKETFKNSIETLCEWSKDKPSIDELFGVFLKISNRLEEITTWN